MFDTILSCRTERPIGGRHDDHHREALLDQRDRPVLELAGREALGVHVGEFLELQRALERHRVPDVPAEEQHAPLDRPGRGRPRAPAPSSAGPAAPSAGICCSCSHQRADLVAELGPAHLGQVEREQVARRPAGSGRPWWTRPRSPGPRACTPRRRTRAGDGRAVDVADRHHAGALLAGVADRHQRVHGLAGLGDRDDQGGPGEDRVAVAELAGQLDLDGDLGTSARWRTWRSSRRGRRSRTPR